MTANMQAASDMELSLSFYVGFMMLKFDLTEISSIFTSVS